MQNKENEKTFTCFFCKNKYQVVEAHGVATQEKTIIDVCDQCFENPPTSQKITYSNYELRNLSDWMLKETL